MTVIASNIGKPRPLGRVIFWSGISLLLYYGWYKWIIQEELRTYRGYGWSGTLCLLPFILGLVLPQAIYFLNPEVGSWIRWLSLLGIAWIYLVQFRLYRTVNQLYKQKGLPKPLVIWWIFVPGLNLIVGLRQIHFLSKFWQQQREEFEDPLVQFIPFLFTNNT
jgi:hypothetical protein